MTMYNGQDASGNQSPPTRFGYSRDYGAFPLAPDPEKPYYGPGYRLDFPDTAGNCAACHLPGAAVNNPYGVNPNAVSGTDEQGIHCDFCHKVAGVRLDPTTGLPFENMPGVLSLVMMRPGPEQQLFFGPYDDVDVGPDTYLPLMKESEICAPCHSASFWGISVYASFDEWKASPYSDPLTGRTCQSCHMAPDHVTTNFAPGRGGLERDPTTLPTHLFPGAADADLLQNAVTLAASAEREEGAVRVTAMIANDLTGHHVPTGSPLRQMLLLVRAFGPDGAPLEQISGSVMPEWAGVGDPDLGYYAGLPGRAFAKVLAELWTDVQPSGAYWNPTRVVSDHRIPALGSDTSVYTFAAPDTGEVRVFVQLIFRRAYIDLADTKGWDRGDVLMEVEYILIP